MYGDKLMALNVVYTTSQFPANLNNDADIKAHDDVVAKGELGVVNSNGRHPLP